MNKSLLRTLKLQFLLPVLSFLCLNFTLGQSGISMSGKIMDNSGQEIHGANIQDDVPNDNVDYNISGIALRDSIREERWRELHYEGHRWYDIQRWGIVVQELEKVPGSANGQFPDEFDRYWPIPLEQIILNPNLTQNDGY